MPYAPESRRAPRRDNRRISASAAGYNHRWLRVASQVRLRDGNMCQHCLREGGLPQAIAEMQSRGQNKDGSTRLPPVGHIKPGHVCTAEEFYNLDNLETLCERHNQLQRVDDMRKYGTAKR